MTQPRIYLAIDNCFASKRWTRPEQWGPIVRDLGVGFVEASADNEVDSLYSTPEVLADWAEAVKRLPEDVGVKVANMYSGHGTYATLGLAHHDRRIRDHIQHDWIEPMIRQAADVGAGLGFFTHAFSQEILADEQTYSQAREDLTARLAEICAYAGEKGLSGVGVEQMYTPHQVPWRLDGAGELMRNVYARAHVPLYLTLDAGHASGQRKFLRPDGDQVARYVRQAQHDPKAYLYVGSANAHEILRSMVRDNDLSAMDQLEAEMDAAGRFFASHEDGDFYAWARRFGCHSPIVHLQQTDGKTSAHWPFTEEYNARGIIEPRRLLAAIAEAYAAEPDPAMGPRCDKIYLTLEIFASTSCYPEQFLDQLARSVAWWREAIPEDGLTLDTLLARDSAVS
jgi:sugar phosphate isomerase/epimerase